MAVEKIKILGAVLELPAKQHCQFGPFTKKSGKMGWQCCLAGSSKTVMGAKLSFYMKSIAKGQLISECLFEKIVWTKIPTKNLIDSAQQRLLPQG